VQGDTLAEREYLHVDPANVVGRDHSWWPETMKRTLGSRELSLFIEGMCLPGKEMRESVLDDLTSFMKCTPAEAVERATHWGAGGFEEWEAAEGDVVAYARETVSSIYSLLWYAYLQAETLYPSLAVATAQHVGAGSDHLDFGSGVGTTSMLFHKLGYRTTLADVGTNLLAFSRYRLERRGVEAAYIDLNTEDLPTAAYDIVTSIDVLAHVPDLQGTVSALHRALRPNGLLFANLVTSGAVGDAPWHLYDDDRGPRRLIQRVGFEPIALIDKNAGIIYRRVDPRSPTHLARTARDAITLGPVRGWYRTVRAKLASLR
jgi:SAM-dependent methyltransferase